jgi:hypothetical protein
MLTRIPSCAKTRPKADLREHCPIGAGGRHFRRRSLSRAWRRRMLNLAPVERRPPIRQAPAMDALPAWLAFLFLLFSGWINRHQQAVIDYLVEENRVLRAVHGSRRLCLTDDQRRRLAVKGHVLGRRHLTTVAGIVTPDTILGWYRRLVAKEYDGSHTRRPVGQPPGRTSPRSSSAWRPRIRPGATLASAAG